MDENAAKVLVVFFNAVVAAFVILFQKTEKSRIMDHAVFHDLGEAGGFDFVLNGTSAGQLGVDLDLHTIGLQAQLLARDLLQDRVHALPHLRPGVEQRDRAVVVRHRQREGLRQLAHGAQAMEMYKAIMFGPSSHTICRGNLCRANNGAGIFAQSIGGGDVGNAVCAEESGFSLYARVDAVDPASR